MPFWLVDFLIILGAYLLGSIPSGLLLGKLRGQDLREVGSGKTGTTNALRALGWKISALVFLADFGKGASVVLLGHWLVQRFGGGADEQDWVAALAAFAGIVGHVRSIYIGFAGGRGVVPALGAVTVMVPPVFVVAFFIAVLVVGLSRYVSLGSLTGAVILPVVVLLYNHFVSNVAVPYIVFAFAASVYVILKHRDNISRLRRGEERRLGQPAGPAS